MTKAALAALALAIGPAAALGAGTGMAIAKTTYSRVGTAHVIARHAHAAGVPRRNGGNAARRARGARSARVSDRGHLRFHSAGAAVIVDVGRVSGTIPGSAVVHFHYNGSPKVTAAFAIHAAGGTIYGRARCRLHNPTSRVPSYRGALRITGGSGRYAHARGHGQLYGVFHRRGYALVVNASGTLRY